MTAIVNGQSISLSQPRGQFTIPWTAGAGDVVHACSRATSAGNAGTAVNWP